MKRGGPLGLHVGCRGRHSAGPDGGVPVQCLRFAEAARIADPARRLRPRPACGRRGPRGFRARSPAAPWPATSTFVQSAGGQGGVQLLGAAFASGPPARGRPSACRSISFRSGRSAGRRPVARRPRRTCPAGRACGPIPSRLVTSSSVFSGDAGHLALFQRLDPRRRRRESRWPPGDARFRRPPRRPRPAAGAANRPFRRPAAGFVQIAPAAGEIARGGPLQCPPGELLANLPQELLDRQNCLSCGSAGEARGLLQSPLFQGDLCFPQLESPGRKHDHAAFPTTYTIRLAAGWVWRRGTSE